MKKKEKLKKTVYLNSKIIDPLSYGTININSTMNSNYSSNDHWMPTGFLHGFYGSDEIAITKGKHYWQDRRDAMWDACSGEMYVY